MLTKEWYKISIFSNLSYVRWDAENLINKDGMINAVIDARRLPSSVATPLFKGTDAWTIPSFHPNDDTGFAANVFQKGNEAVLAIRGTEVNLIEALPFVEGPGMADLLDADMHDIRVYGFALDQTVGLFNYVMRLQADVGNHAVRQVALEITTVRAGTDPGIDAPFIKVPGSAGLIDVDTYYWLRPIAPATGLGVLTPGANITVTGHSLGGHLAAMAVRLFPGLIDQAITFNAPGFDPALSLELTDKFVELFGNFMSVAPAQIFADIEGRVTAIESENSAPGNDISVVSSLLTGIPVGEEVLAHTENNSHSMDQLMDALAVHSLIATLNPALDFSQLMRLYDGTSPDPGVTDETLVGALAQIILGEQPTLDEVEANIISHGAFADRVAIHNQIVAIQGQVQTRGLTLETLWDKTAAELAALVESSSAYRYAIQNLNPFVILGDESLYLDLPDSGTFMSNLYSDAYWLARSEMLLAKFNFGLLDGELEDTGGLVISYSDLARNFEVAIVTSDVDATAQTLFVGEHGMGVVALSGTSAADRIFGGAGADQLTGGAGSDYIDGGAGSDTLVGGNDIQTSGDGAIDRLEGGAGADVYYAGDGDVISDSDRLVSRIYLAGQTVSLAYDWVEDGLFQTTDGTRSLEIFGNDARITIATVFSSATLTIVNFLAPGSAFLEGEFGITLNVPDLEYLPEGGITRVGTPHSDNVWDIEDGGYGNAGAVSGTNGNDGIAGLEGNDYIATGLGADYVDAGPGKDFVFSINESQFTLDLLGDAFLGGPGADHLRGASGDDLIFGGEDQDFIQGGNGADYLSGGGDADKIFGGDGSDIIYGGSGMDLIYGDLGLVSISPQTWLQLSTNLPSNWRQQAFAVSGNSVPPTGDDSIWGGSGSDSLHGLGGDDRLYGGSGADTMTGGDGADRLFGELGNDWMQGGDGDDQLVGGVGLDVLFGAVGDDELHGGDGDDWLAGGPGTDDLNGGIGNDRYEYLAGDGWDLIREMTAAPDAANQIYFNSGDYAVSYQWLRSGADLVIQNLEDDAGIIVENWFTDPESVLDEVHFADRTLNIADMTALVAGQGTRWSDVFYGGTFDDRFEAGGGGDYGFGGDGNDVMYGGDGEDLLSGGAGNDRLFGDNGLDIIDAGPGNDFLSAGGGASPAGSTVAGQRDNLSGGEGDDTYIVDVGQGVSAYIVDVDAAGNDQDVLWLQGNVEFEDLVIYRESSNGVQTPSLLINYLSGADGGVAKITIFNWFGTSSGKMEAIKLDDGSVITSEDINARLNNPSSGRDYLTGTGDLVTLNGLAGDDQLFGSGVKNDLQGGAGADQLIATGIENFLYGGDGADQLRASGAPTTAGNAVFPVHILMGGAGQDDIESSVVGSTETGVTTWYMDGGDDGDRLTLHGGSSAILAGGGGFDSITGNLDAMDTVILLNRGDRGDVITSASGWGAGASHVVSFGGGITLNDIALKQDGNDLLILTGHLEGLRLADYFDAQGAPATWLTQIQIVSQATSAYESGAPSPDQSSPVLLLDFNPILSEYLQERTGPDQAWRIINGNSTQEVEYLTTSAVGGQVAYEYALLGSTAIAHMGDQVWMALRGVTDTSTPVTISVLPTEPVVGAVVESLQALEDEVFSYQLPEELLLDPLSQESLQVVMESELPPWLSFDPFTRVLSGTPSQQDIGTTALSVSASNRFGQQTTTAIELAVSNTNDAPAVEIAANQVTITAGAEFQYVLPAGMFSDADPGDHLVISIAATAGGSLPGWIQFALDSGVLSGTPPVSAIGTTAVMIVASDSVGATASSTLTITVESSPVPEGEIITGSGGSDVLVGSDGNDRISGGAGRDELRGGAGDDYLDGGEKDDIVFGGPGHDYLLGGTGGDQLWGDGGNDDLLGGQGSDRVFGGEGDDHLSGEQGNDWLFGGDGNDLLVAEFGNDQLAGGVGNDRYEVMGNAGKVTISDTGGEDAIHFAALGSDAVKFSRQRGDLILKASGTNTKVVISNWFSDPEARLESIVFSDGVTLLEQDVLRLVQHRAAFAARSPDLSLATESPGDAGFIPVMAWSERFADGAESSVVHGWRV